MKDKEYVNIHQWLRRNVTKENKCEFCNTTKGTFDNALKKDCKHKRDVNNYLKLCRKCHFHYDNPQGMVFSEETKAKMSKSRIGIKLSDETKKRMSVHKTSEKHHQSKRIVDESNGKTYFSIRDAANDLNIKYGTLAAMLNGQNPNKTTLKLL